MKTPALLSKSIRFLFGNVSWQPPAWMMRIGDGWTRLKQKYPRLIAPAIAAALLLSCSGAWTWHWYQNLPKPRRVTVKVDPIAVTKLEKYLIYPNLTLYFSEPVARLEDRNNQALRGVELQPQIKGTWHWAADDVLCFKPGEDWPADQTFKIVFDRKFFPRHILVERFAYEAHTPSFAITVRKFELYQDPTTAGKREVTATLELTHSIDPGELDRYLSVAMIGNARVFSPNDLSSHFSLTYGLHRRLVYLRTSSITLPEHEDFMKLTVNKGVHASQGGAQTKDEVEAKSRIPSMANLFQVDSIRSTITRNKTGEPEQVIVLTTTADINTQELARALEIRLLPKRKIPESEKAAADSTEDVDETEESPENPEADEPAYDSSGQSHPNEKEMWKSASDVPQEVFADAKRIEFTALPSGKPLDQQHAFRVRVETDGELYLRLAKGVRAFGDYPLKDDYNAVVEVPQLPREVQIEGEGGLLALNGERKLSVRSRGLAAIEYEIARVATSQINHLVSQTQGQFQHPQFRAPWLFNRENISRVAIEHQPIALENKWKANYSAFDFSEQLHKPADGGSERGVFFLTARGWDAEKKKPINTARDGRFLLVTDIGIITKKNADGSHDVFLMSIKQGRPMPNVAVDLLGKNGIPLQSAKTDDEGHCAFSSVEKSQHEKTPVAFVARNGDDVAFIPYERADRTLNLSRFDIGGVDNVMPENLDSFVFTERGVYRPGDEMHIGLIVKQRNWQGHLKGLPVETDIVDARGLSVQTKKINLPETGFAELTYQTANESPTGLYTINVFLIKNTKRSTLLGSATANVKEFLPDRMKIETRLSATAPRGWLSPKEMKASIALANLYGTPATDRRITARIELAPTAFRFAEFRDFTFYDPLAEQKRDAHDQTVDLGEKKTNDAGQTEFDLQLERFADATYAMRFIAEGFEGEGGRSVTGQTGTLVSALPYVIGYKPDGELRYIDMNKPRALDLVAVDPQLTRIALENITLNVIALEYVSVLTKQENGNYGYESVLQERITKSEKISVSANGLHYDLPTAEPGNYLFELRDDQDRRLTKMDFCVVGHGTPARPLDKNAELQVKLDRAQYKSGDDIAISVTAPYAGSGLITIERDRVYAHQWFQSPSAGSVQRIRVPADFEGSGYINVSFVRALDSKEVFMSPLSYGVAPFTANMEKRRLKIDIDTPATAKPGEPLRISYRAERPCQIVLFAVDQGILQVTDYKTPDPLAFYFRKCALRVDTAQIVDLIIPEFSLLRSVSAFGGGGDLQRLNPFKRVTEKPVVFWSGIVDADTKKREVVYDLPDFFDGTLKIMAVAVSNETTGSTERDALIRGPFVITPSVPVLAAPGDEFEAGVTVANNVEGSGPNAEIEVRALTSEQLSILRSPSQRLRIAEGREQSTAFKFRVNNKLGSGQVTFVASINGKETRRHATMSVRPPAPYMTEVRSGSFSKTRAEVPITRTMHPEFRKLEASVSALPLGLAHGLDVYLKDFPHGCSEQISSGAFCRLMLADETDFGLSRAEVNKQLEYTFGVLRRRQNDQGAFGYWAPENGEHISFVSVYAMDFLSEAKAAGFAPPQEMFASGLRNLQKMVGREPSNFSDARIVAYAIYILTREGVITTNYILNLRDYLEKHSRDAWQNDITGVYLAGALHLLHKDAESERLVACYKIDKQTSRPWDDFCQPLGSDSQYLAVLAREFPARLRKISADQLDQILQPIGDGQFNTLSAAYAVRALKAYSQTIAQDPPELSMAEIRSDKTDHRLINGAKLLLRSNFSGNATALRFDVSKRISGPGAFFQVVEAGFDRQVPNEKLSSGLEVYRELLDQNYNAVTTTHLGQPIRVRLHVRSLRREPITNVAVVDLLPGGFEIVDSSVRAGASTLPHVDYVDLREDRAVFFATAPSYALEINYQIKSCNRGEFVVPPVFAESMYDRNVKGRGVGGKMTVTE